MQKDETDSLPDPLLNIRILFQFLLEVLNIFFARIIPLLALIFFIILSVLYLFFKIFGLV